MVMAGPVESHCYWWKLKKFQTHKTALHSGLGDTFVFEKVRARIEAAFLKVWGQKTSSSFCNF
jgi:hypothetical protein